MADRGDTDGVLIVCQLIDDAIGAHAQRAQTAEPTTQLVPCLRLALERSESVLDGVDQGPAEIEQLLPGTPGNNDGGHASAGGATLSEFLAELLQGDAVAPHEVGEASFDRRERRGIRKDLGGLLQGFVSSIGTSAAAGLPLRVTRT
jgi:hypothetical protein